MKIFAMAGLAAAALFVLVSTGQAAGCGNSAAGFEPWLADFKGEAAAQGISGRALASLDGLTYAPAIIRADRSQHVFQQSFEVFSARMISAARVSRARAMLQHHAATLARIERQFGVPGAVVVAIWALETDFGANMGGFPVLRSLATLAYDCRRSAMFQNELISALKIIQRGDLNPAQMRGAWAGEMGQAQFMASKYLQYGVDFDGNGRRDLIHSAPDVLASIASYLRGYGWQRGAGWDPGEGNFGVIQQWNKSQVYARTIAAFASRLAGG